MSKRDELKRTQVPRVVEQRAPRLESTSFQLVGEQPHYWLVDRTIQVKKISFWAEVECEVRLEVVGEDGFGHFVKTTSEISTTDMNVTLEQQIVKITKSGEGSCAITVHWK